MLQHRIAHTTPERPIKVTVWDGFGYYMYLPAFLLYDDYKQLNWVPHIDSIYQMTGGDGVQATMLANGDYTFKYLGGVAIMQLPLFALGHVIAGQMNYPQDGFSPPYQYAISYGALLYCLLAIFLLRRILLCYFSDLTTALTLLLLILATNALHYLPVDNGQSHAWIFVLYVIVLFTALKWHQQPKMIWAALTGFIIGLATISRPTEAIMLFIPLLWNTHPKEAARQKWAMVRQQKGHILCAALFGLVGIMPQLIYWKLSTGSFIYDVGSRWDFLNPHFRVLFGWEKGWFIYTPITLFFIVGLFFIKSFPFRRSVLWFCILNIWIIIAWHEWRYAASYATRALVQSYPVFALPFAAFIERIRSAKWRYAFYVLALYFTCYNIFQLRQWWSGALHYDDMNRKYFTRLYWNAHPSPLDMSLLDNDEILTSESAYSKTDIAALPSHSLNFPSGSSVLLEEAITTNNEDAWLKIEADIKAPNAQWLSYLNAELQTGDSIKKARVRLFRPLVKVDSFNHYEFHVSIPAYFRSSRLKLFLTAAGDFNGEINNLRVTQLEKQDE